MSRFLAPQIAALTPYTPGEQPIERKYIKLNTNECPYPPSPAAAEAIAAFSAEQLRLYPDPTASALKSVAAQAAGVDLASVFIGGGSDEVLAYAFMAFCPRNGEVCFPDITYGFYRVYAELFELRPMLVPLGDDFRIRMRDYADIRAPVFLANPNAPTGLCLSLSDIETLLCQNRNRLLIVDEAYMDFASEQSCRALIAEYDNLLIVQTASKSWALAGLRLGFGYGNPALIAGLERIKFSFNPYNLDRITLSVAQAVLMDRAYTAGIVSRVIDTREFVIREMLKMGFEVLPSQANFLMARHPCIAGHTLYIRIKENGILVRHFTQPRISDYIRVSIGSENEMSAFLTVCRTILEEVQP